MSKIIEISGYMYEANVIDLTDEELESFMGALKLGDEVWETNRGLEERLRGDSIINGYRVEDGAPLFSVSFDGVKVPFEKFDVSLDLGEEPVPKLDSHQLVLEKWCGSGSSSLGITERFSPEKLKLFTDKITLPDGARHLVVSASYGDEDLEFQESFTDEEIIYIVKKDGEVVRL